MTTTSLEFGDIVTARFPEHNPQGREQQGYRPAIVVGFPNRIGIPRFSLVIVVPMTTDKGQLWALSSPHLYPRFPIGVAQLRTPSIALLDQVRVIDVNRIVAYRGSLTPDQYEPILIGLQRIISP
ncbi:type II toxin-antitoxin system PemK/MazF family toxin [Scytonema sp. UIC 10036]|uniref:type II toxin-antitoxin system PemK/MazF family toxin n=1 Tax=Scytonema sp. UIC 10036 TaxID=2304196 RepID=UPI0012DA2972|nr:type II toxin-antitoxin system PemK/MazF family toxin [Scytonema sp. UIC 10036]MUG98660.1 type II toxin-antitoxin system PemK/MazF family toxin [Scytonema sp. UIC 10036]